MPLAHETKTIAIVDDHYLWREKLGEILSEYSFTVIMTAEDGAQFLTQLKTTTSLPDLCLLDITMPEMNGFETMWHLKKLYPQIKVLAFSMDKDSETVGRILKAGAHGFLPKGVPPTEIRDALLKLLE